MYIYQVTNCINGKFYIGQTINYKSRWDAHKRSTYSDIGKAINQYGVDYFSFKVLFECNQRDANLLESYLILKYDTINNGYNKVLSKKMDDIDIKKAERLLISIRDKTYVLTGEYMAKSGDKRPVYCLEENLTFSNAEECRTFYNIVTSTRVRDICLGKRATANGLTFRFLDENGDIVQPETCAKKKATEVYVEEVASFYDSIKSACVDLGIDYEDGKSSISKHLLGKTEHAYNYHWHYVIDEEIQPSRYVSKRKVHKVVVDGINVFNCVSDAIKYYNLPSNAHGAISQCARGKSSNAYGHTWDYMDEDGVITVNTFKKSDIDRSKVKRYEIICDDKLVFKSLAKAVEYFGLNSNCARVIAKVCKGELESAYGHTWKYGKEL